MKTFFSLIISGYFFILLMLFLTCRSYSQVIPENSLYGSDVKVTQQLSSSVMTSKLMVANNGWIYVMARFNGHDPLYQGWHLFCSKDNGRSFTALIWKDFNTQQDTIKDVDFVVTGNDSASIALFVAEAVTKGPSGTEDSYCSITRYDAAGHLVEIPYNYKWGANPINTLSIATDFRSPDLQYDQPFAVALAWTGTALNTQEDHLTSAISTDGGNTFKSNFLYSQALPKRLGKVSITIGSFGNMYEGAYGVAFELNKSASGLGDIGVIVNHLPYHLYWTVPVIVTTIMGKDPVICFKQKSALVVPSPNYNSLVVFNAFTDGLTIKKIHYSYLDYSFFNSGIHQATALDFQNFDLLPNVQTEQPALSYDKSSDKFLVTWYSPDDNNLHFGLMPALQPSVIEDKGYYRDNNSMLTWGPYSRVDVNPSNGKACFSWTETDNWGENVFFDSEWSIMGFGEASGNQGDCLLKIFPNPVKDLLHLEFTGREPAIVCIDNTAGIDVKEFTVFPGKNTFQTSTLPSGIYLLHLKGVSPGPVRKLVVL